MTKLDRAMAEVDRLRRQNRFIPKTRVVLLVWLTACTVLNVGELGLHIFYPDKLEIWLKLSAPLTRAIAKFIPAINQVFFYISNTPSADRAYLLQNLLAMNWLITILFYIVVPIVFIIEAPRYAESISVVWSYIRLDSPYTRPFSPVSRLAKYIFKTDLGSFVFFLVIGVISLVMTSHGWAFNREDLFSLYSNDFKTFFISAYFIFNDLALFGLLVSGASLFVRSSRNTRSR